MKFPYREYVGELPGTSDFQLILRPVITVRVVSPKAEARWDALVDSGADETLLPISLAKVLDIELHAATSRAAGVSGEQLTIHYGDVELQIACGLEVVRWRTTVGFVEFGVSNDELVILGHGGCLDYFTATFDGEHAELELTPNGLLPQ